MEKILIIEDDENLTEIQELKLIDVEIKSILNEKAKIEQEKEMEIHGEFF